MNDQRTAIKRFYTMEEPEDRANNLNNHTGNDSSEINISITRHIPGGAKNKQNLKRIYTKQIEKKSVEAEKVIVKKQIRNYNININYTELSPKRRSYSHEKINFNNLWRKSINFVRMSNAFLHPPLERIEDNDIFDDSMKLSLLGIKKEEKKYINSKKDVITYEQFLRKTPVEKEFIRVSLKEKAYKLIEDGPKEKESLIESFEILFNQNPEKNRYYPNDKKYLFNQPLVNGKTLLYIACQEGVEDIVRYFLKKGLDPNIKSRYCGMEDSCLGVASRWGYANIVEALLETGKIDKYAISEQLDNKQISQNIKDILLSYLPDKGNKKGCACF